MKYLKMLGLAAVAAMALTAFLGASSASATVLCTTNSNPCGAGWHIDTLEASLVKGSSAVLSNTEESIVDTCTESSVKATKKATGSSTTTPVGEVTAANLTFTECSNPTSVTGGGELEVHWTKGTTGTVTAKGFKVVVNLGVNCTFTAGTGISLGDIEGGTDVLHVNTVVQGSGFLCPTTGRWKADYTITNHKVVYVEPS